MNQATPSVDDEQVALDLLTKGWDGMLSGSGRQLLETTLPQWLAKQRWFGAKTRAVASCEIGHWVKMPTSTPGVILQTIALPPASTLGDVILLLDLAYRDGSSDRYQLPLAYATGADLQSLRETKPGSIIAEVSSPTGPGAFHDAVVREEFRQALLRLVHHGESLAVEDSHIAAEQVAATLIAAHESRPAHEVASEEARGIADAIEATHSIETEVVAPEFVGHMPGAVEPPAASEEGLGMHGSGLRGEPSQTFAAAHGDGSLPARIGSAEQSNTNILYGQQILMKLFRRLQPGLNPDIEIGRFLTDVAHFDRIAPFLGEISLQEQDSGRTSLAMVQGLVANEGDGWEWTQAQLAGFYAAAEDSNKSVESLAGSYLDDATLLGRRTAEMHLALATPTYDPAFAAESFAQQDYGRDAQRLEAQITSAMSALEAAAGNLTGEAATRAAQVLAKRADLVAQARSVADIQPSGQRIRIHGDYHLGQILRTKNDFVLLDFEGEPAKTLEERRRKQCPLRDVAGMLRSFSYAAASALNACPAESHARLAPLARAWETAVCERFLKAYTAAAAADDKLLPEPAAANLMLQGYVLEKALYELLYELNNRPAWIGIPLAGILKLSATSTPV